MNVIRHCPECFKDGEADAQETHLTCPHCGFQWEVESAVDEIITSVAPALREEITRMMTANVDEMVAVVLSDLRKRLEEGLCTFDFHVSPAEFDAQSNCRGCGKHSSEHEVVRVCKEDG